MIILRFSCGIVVAAVLIAGCGKKEPRREPEALPAEVGRVGGHDKASGETGRPAPSARVETEEEREKKKNGFRKDPAAALNEPGMGAPEIPVHPDLIEPIDYRSNGDEQEDFRQRVANALWNTPLGQMFYAYLFTLEAKEQIPFVAQQITDRIFTNGSHLANRVSALHFMAADLYTRDRMTKEASDRITVLQNAIYQKTQQVGDESKDIAIMTAIGFFLSSLPFGSPVVRAEASNVFQGLKKMFLRGIGQGVDSSAKVAIGRIFSSEVFSNYEPGRAASFFFSTFGPYTILYWAYRDWLGAAIGKHTGDVEMLFGLDKLMQLMDAGK